MPGLPPSTTDALTAVGPCWADATVSKDDGNPAADGGEETDPNAVVAFSETSAAAPMSTAKTTVNRDLAALRMVLLSCCGCRGRIRAR